MEIICKGNLVTDFCNNKTTADVNYSDIFSFLIKEVGTKVQSYASDLYYDLKNIENAIKMDNPRDAYFLIGLRTMGVDSKEIIKTKMENPDTYNTEYIAIYSVNIKINKENDEIQVVLKDIKTDTIINEDLAR